MDLRALGATALRIPPSGAAAALGAKALGLIVHLAENAPRPATRDALAELLWERSAPAQGRGSLRQELRRIKKAVGAERFGAAFTVSDTHIGLVEGALRYDAAEMAAAAAADDAETLARVLTLYGGDFLADNAARADSFQNWARERREGLKDMAVAALCRLGALDLEAGRTERAQRAAERVVAMDPLHEQGHEVLIRCHLANGRRGQARAHFERFRALMLRELAVEPMREIAELVAPGAGGGARRPPARRGGRDERPMIAVLDVSARPTDDHAYLAGGVVDQIVANLLRTAWIRVASLNPGVFLQGEPGVETGQRDLRDYADYVLRVDVRMAAERVAIEATLTRVADGAAIFSDRMEDGFADLLALQRRVAHRVASVFEPLVLDDQARREAAPDWSETEDLNHWRLLMRARWIFWTMTRENNREARRILTRALKTAPRNVPTHCILAFSHMLDAWSDWTADIGGAVRDAQGWARKAVEIAPNDGWAHFALGVACSAPESLDEARDRLRHALRLAPSLVAATGELARVLVCRGETGEALRLADEALALSPYDQHAGMWLRTKALARWLEGDAGAALDLVDFALIVRPGWPQNHYLRAAILSETGDARAARAALTQGEGLMGSYSDAALRIGHPFRDEAQYARLARALNRAGGRFAVSEPDLKPIE